jgi:hypothetical protein
VLSERCLGWLSELSTEIPTIVVAVVDARGRDRADAQVIIDGREHPGAAAGEKLALDPGPHLVVASQRGQRVEQRIVLRAGERLRHVRLALAAPAPAPEPTPDESGGTLTALGWVSLSVGAAGLVVGAVAGGLALAKKSELDEACPTATTCPPDRAGDIDTLETRAHVSTAGLAVGVAGVAVGVLLLLLGTEGSDRSDGSEASSQVTSRDSLLRWRF